MTVVGPVMVTLTSSMPVPSRPLTWTPSVPWLAPKAPTGGATRLDCVIGAIGVLTRFDVVVEVIRM